MCIPKRYEYCVNCFYIEDLKNLVSCIQCDELVCLPCLNNNYCKKCVFDNVKYLTCLQCDFISTLHCNFTNCRICNKSCCTICADSCSDCQKLINNMIKISLH